MSWKQADDIRKAPQAGSERCPRCASSDRNGECFAPTGPKDTPRHPWHFPPEIRKEYTVGVDLASGLDRTAIGESGKEGLMFNDGLTSEERKAALTPAPAQGAEEWRKSHTRFSSVERQYYWNDVTVDAYAAHVTAAKDKEATIGRAAIDMEQKKQIVRSWMTEEGKKGNLVEAGWCPEYAAYKESVSRFIELVNAALSPERMEVGSEMD